MSASPKIVAKQFFTDSLENHQNTLTMAVVLVAMDEE